MTAALRPYTPTADRLAAAIREAVALLETGRPGEAAQLLRLHVPCDPPLFDFIPPPPPRLPPAPSPPPPPTGRAA
jgi:hypothetical protein